MYLHRNLQATLDEQDQWVMQNHVKLNPSKKLLKSFGTSRRDLIRIWTTCVRPILEYALPPYGTTHSHPHCVNTSKWSRSAPWSISAGKSTRIKNQRFSPFVSPPVSRRASPSDHDEICYGLVLAPPEAARARPDNQCPIQLRREPQSLLEEIRCRSQRYYKFTILSVDRILNTERRSFDRSDPSSDLRP